MNATQQNASAAEAPAQTAEPVSSDHADLIRQIIDEMDAANPYGGKNYTDEDAKALGIESLGSLRVANKLMRAWWNSPMIPKWIMESKNPEGTFVAAVLRGHELGFKMMETMSALYLSPDGRLGLYASAMVALMLRSGVKLTYTELGGTDPKENPNYGMRVHGVRPDGQEYTSEFTRADVLRAGLKRVHDSYPRWMCKWRALSDLFRTLCADLSGGPLYTREELEEDERDRQEAQPQQGTATTGTAEAREAVRASKVAAITVVPPKPKPPVTAENTAPAEPEPAEPVIVDDETDSVLEEVDDSDAAEPIEETQSDEQPKHEPLHIADIRTLELKLKTAQLGAKFSAIMERHGVERIEDVAEENSMAIIADLEEALPPKAGTRGNRLGKP